MTARAIGKKTLNEYTWIFLRDCADELCEALMILSNCVGYIIL
jgi:hypothetical protein